MLNTLITPSGRINPAQFQSAALLLIGVGFIIGLLPLVSMKIGMAAGLISILLIWPWVCILMKRARDAGKSGWFCLIAILALIILSLVIGQVVMSMFGGDMADQMKEIEESGDLTAMMEMAGEMGAKTAIPSAIGSAIVSLIVAFGYNSFLKQDGENQHGRAT